MSLYTFDVLNNGKFKKVRGEKIGEYFGMDYRVRQGWVITHIPTGTLLTFCNFAQREDAQFFAELAEKIYGDVLARPDIKVLLDNRYNVPGGVAFYALRCQLEDLECLIERPMIDAAIKRIVDIDQEQGKYLISETGIVENAT